MNFDLLSTKWQPISGKNNVERNNVSGKANSNRHKYTPQVQKKCLQINAWTWNNSKKEVCIGTREHCIKGSSGSASVHLLIVMCRELRQLCTNIRCMQFRSTNICKYLH